MCEEISILRRWQHVSDRPPLLPPQSSDRALYVRRVLASALDWNFLVILLYYILVKWVRCHLDVTWGLGDWNSSRNTPEPARQWVHGQLLTMTGRLLSSSSSSSSKQILNERLILRHFATSTVVPMGRKKYKHFYFSLKTLSNGLYYLMQEACEILKWFVYRPADPWILYTSCARCCAQRESTIDRFSNRKWAKNSSNRRAQVQVSLKIDHSSIFTWEISEKAAKSEGTDAGLSSKWTIRRFSND